MSEWISIKQRLPKEYGQILIFTEYGDTSTCYYYTTRQHAFDFPDNITHWMPLPEPPKD